jgi:hypothetical protein
VSLTHEKKTGPTSNLSKGLKSNSGSLKEKTEEESKGDEKERFEDMFGLESENSATHSADIKNQFIKSNPVAASKSFSIARPGEIVFLDIYDEMKLCGDILLRLSHKGSFQSTFI